MSLTECLKCVFFFLFCWHIWCPCTSPLNLNIWFHIFTSLPCLIHSPLHITAHYNLMRCTCSANQVGYFNYHSSIGAGPVQQNSQLLLIVTITVNRQHNYYRVLLGIRVKIMGKVMKSQRVLSLISLFIWKFKVSYRVLMWFTNPALISEKCWTWNFFIIRLCHGQTVKLFCFVFLCFSAVMDGQTGMM